MKAATHRSTSIIGHSVGLAQYETPRPEQVYCPMIGNTLPLESCQWRRQATPPTCRVDKDGNCNVKPRTAAPKIGPEALQKIKEKAAHKSVERIQRTQKMIALYAQGMTIREIAETMQLRRDTVYKRLRENGIHQSTSQIVKIQVFNHLTANPDTTTRELSAMFSCPLSTASTYRGEFFRLAKKAEKKNDSHEDTEDTGIKRGSI